MSLSVSYKQNINSGIDTAALKEVTQQIFQRAASKTADLSSLDLTKFNRGNIGLDLYSSKVDLTTARQVAMTNSGMQVNLSNNTLNSLKYLSSEASKSIFKVVEGKINPALKEEATEIKKSLELPAFGRLTETADLGSDKRGSNPFYKGELLANKKEEKQEEVINIFA